MAHHIEERQYFPDGCSPDDPDASSFMVSVVHRGRGKWAVLKRGQRYVQLSSTGKWLVAPARMNELTHCRHDFTVACALAETAVETLEVHGRTWAQWSAQQNGHATATNPEVELAEAAPDLG
ncbi:hypothetical protein [Kocuria arenosa]|uniref:hypothetical protein n=1 Tax=Kocuria arenosa TaxID=3071446 RepID=UPI0034D58792